MKFNDLSQSSKEHAARALEVMIAEQIRPCVLPQGNEKADIDKAERLGRIVASAFFALEGKNKDDDAKPNDFRVGIFSASDDDSENLHLRLKVSLKTDIEQSSVSSGRLRLKNGTRVDFWSGVNLLAGRGREYDIVLIDYAFFSTDSLGELWIKSIVPSLLTRKGKVLTLDLSGKSPVKEFRIDVNYVTSVVSFEDLTDLCK
jgi:hypothetical protein